MQTRDVVSPDGFSCCFRFRAQIIFRKVWAPAINTKMNSSNRFRVGLLGCALITIFVFAAGCAVEKPTPAAPPGLETVWKIIADKHNEYRNNTKYWSFAFHGSLCLAAFLSAAGGIILKLESILKNKEQVKKDIAAICAGLAALLLTLTATTDANRKWQSNRVAEYATENLLYEMATTSSNDVKRVYKQLEEIVARQNEGILGTDPKPTNGTEKLSNP